LRNNLLARAELLGKIASPIAPLANFLLNLKILRRILETTLKIHHHAPLPSFSSERFTSWFTKYRQINQTERKDVYNHACSTQNYEPWIGRAAVRVLEANGLGDRPQQNCVVSLLSMANLMLPGAITSAMYSI
jgi:glycerol-3-phosphate dehydrogenase subunit C